MCHRCCERGMWCICWHLTAYETIVGAGGEREFVQYEDAGVRLGEDSCLEGLGRWDSLLPWYYC